MFILEGSNEDLKAINTESKRLISILISDIAPMRSACKINQGKEVFGDAEEGLLYLLRDGHVNYLKNGQTIYIYDEGDLIGLEKINGGEYSTYMADADVVLDEYSVDILYDEIKKNPVKFELWNRYLSLQINVHGLLVAALMKAEVEYKPTVKSFGRGDVIIEEGSSGTEVYTMLSGVAEVFVSHVRVGEIHTDEIFGAIAALTGLPRTATIKAVTPCTVVVIDKESFNHLIETRPNTIFKLAEDMTRVIVSTNEKLVNMSKQMQ